MYSRILVAVDGSATSLKGLDEGVRIAKAMGGRLVLRHSPVPVLLVRDQPVD